MRFDIQRKSDGTVEIVDLRTGETELVNVSIDAVATPKSYDVRPLALPSHKICLAQA